MQEGGEDKGNKTLYEIKKKKMYSRRWTGRVKLQLFVAAVLQLLDASPSGSAHLNIWIRCVLPLLPITDIRHVSIDYIIELRK